MPKRTLKISRQDEAAALLCKLLRAMSSPTPDDKYLLDKPTLEEACRLTLSLIREKRKGAKKKQEPPQSLDRMAIKVINEVLDRCPDEPEDNVIRKVCDEFERRGKFNADGNPDTNRKRIRNWLRRQKAIRCTDQTGDD